MPEDRNVNCEFLAKFFAGEKVLLRLAEVKFVRQVCGYRELSTANLLQTCPKIDDVLRYLPDLQDRRKLDRSYAMNVP